MTREVADQWCSALKTEDGTASRLHDMAMARPDDDMRGPDYRTGAQVDRYEDEIYRPGGFDDVLWRVEQRVLGKLIARHAPNHRTARTLDFACGTGRIAAFMRPQVRSVVGVDISEAMLERARAKVAGVDFIRADILTEPGRAPDQVDIITCFRFVLRASPALREACIGALAAKLRSEDSLLILGIHGNPHSRRALASALNRVMRHRRASLPSFSMRDAARLAAGCGLRIVGAAGFGYCPRTIGERVPRRLFESVEHALCDRPLLWRFGTHLIVVCRRAGTSSRRGVAGADGARFEGCGAMNSSQPAVGDDAAVR